MSDNMKYVFHVPDVRKVALGNVSLRNEFLNIGEEPMFIFLL